MGWPRSRYYNKWFWANTQLFGQQVIIGWRMPGNAPDAQVNYLIHGKRLDMPLYCSEQEFNQMLVREATLAERERLNLMDFTSR